MELKNASCPFANPAAEVPRFSEEDPRVGGLLGRDLDSGESPVAAIIGFPTDVGVARNGGRVGAALAPDEIRRLFYKLTPGGENPESMARLLRRSLDLGNFKTTGDLEADQEGLGVCVSKLLKQGSVVIILGGGHETAFGHFLGYAQLGREVSVLNWDAHADVRPLKGGAGHSGSPFRQALLHPSKCCRSYRVAGLLPHSNATSHLEFVRAQGGSYQFREGLTDETIVSLYSYLGGAVMVSFDMDAVDQSLAPGVSAPAVGGMDWIAWRRAARLAGSCREVQSIDLVEVNPVVDPGGQTARLGAVTLWQFLLGLSEREGFQF